ncbi:MAG: 50S ribosomal protein L15 [Candidatus Eisenbacteria bacterium]
MKLNQLRPSAGARKKRKRLGCGEGSGHGGTSTKGHKGLQARSGGKVPAWFEGGQMPIQRRLPKRGFTSRSHKEYQVVNLENLAALGGAAEVTPESLLERRLIRSLSKPVKMLGTGNVSTAFKVKVHAISKTARAKLEQAGGSVELIS